jgi:hypothetical protein
VPKIDFEKPFETLDHEALLHTMRVRGFPKQFLRWAKEVLASENTSSILLDGLPWKPFHYKRGVT